MGGFVSKAPTTPEILFVSKVLLKSNLVVSLHMENNIDRLVAVGKHQQFQTCESLFLQLEVVQLAEDAPDGSAHTALFEGQLCANCSNLMTQLVFAANKVS